MYPWRTPITTRWMDNDVYGHVNNVTYYSYFDTAANLYLIREGGLDIHAAPVIGVVVESRCNYRAAIAFPDAVTAGVRVDKLGNRAVTYGIGIFRGAETTPAAEGHFVHVFVDRQTRKPVPIPEPLRAALAKILVAAAVMAFALPAAADELVAVKLSATSTLRGKTAGQYAAENVLWESLYDAGEPTSAWCEGKPDEGIGETLTVELGAPTKVASVSVKAGFWKNEELWKANNQLTGLDVITDDGRVIHAAPPATMDAVEIAIGGSPVKRLDFRITKVKKGRMNDTCITGIALTTAPAAQLVLGADPELVAAIPRVEHALSGCEERELAAAIGFPFRYEPADDDEGKRAKPVEHRSAADLAKACKKRPDAVPKGGLPGINVFENKGMTYLHSANCGASPCYQWGFQKREGGWRLVWVGEGADNPYRK